MTKYRCGHQLQTWNGNQRNCFSPAIAVILIHQCLLHKWLEISDSTVFYKLVLRKMLLSYLVVLFGECLCFFLSMFLFYFSVFVSLRLRQLFHVCLCLTLNRKYTPYLSSFGAILLSSRDY